ncbi:hypothetical protein [Pimelobacter simplex]|uniref:hypothetical protein n=1 Tax=Nocardioides simplex TaxID=2045 RepID=UPI002150298C|nr:hypothetical protein [Pimelobacter simplex]UUW88400.1 hypothetical protein M0M43_22010 [Pimelobacter simplex]UUW97904.1 hypothetical protein M0M48_10655 [Pimelobacter simplex]
MAGVSSNLDLQPIADAIKAAIQAELPARVTVYDTDDIPGTAGGSDPSGAAPAKHVEIHLNRADAFPSRRGSGVVSVPDLELATRCHAGSIADVRELRRRVGRALEDRAYGLLDGGTVGPFVFAIGEPEEDDDTGWVGVDHWTFA